MSSDLQKLRAAAEPYKSFPKAVAAVVRAMFDRGATEVEVVFEESDNSVDLWIFAKDVLFTRVDMIKIIDLRAASIGLFPNNIGLTFVHHAMELVVLGGHCCMSVVLETPTEFLEDGHTPDEQTCGFGFLGLSQGEGVNPKQDRSAKRLVRELPRHLSPSEAYRTVVIDEQGKEHKLVKSLPSTTINGLRISWPEKMIGFGREGLTLKFGAVWVSMKSFLARLIIEPQEREQLMLLTHPWLQGIVEIEVADPQVADIPIPPKPGDNLSNFIIPSRHAEQLAMAILQIVPAVALREMNRTIRSNMRDFFGSFDEFVLDGQEYSASCAQLDDIQDGEGRLIWKPSVQYPGHLFLALDATHPVFRTIGPDRDEIMQVIWWQLAIWIAQNQPEVFEEAVHFNLRVNQIYLALREQNPECWDD